jgi:hypothetical protein
MVNITTVDNCQVWGNIIGRSAIFPHIVNFDDAHYHHPVPGMLVSSYTGTRRAGEGKYLGLGIVISVMPHPRARGDVRWLCTVVWNYENPPRSYVLDDLDHF